ncbi:MAG: hypothetical protein ABSA63_01135 [Thermoplasmata archaeon]|jgi:hypothetical protein
MAEPACRTILVVNGRVHEIPARRSSDRVRAEGSVTWWESLALFGGSLVILGLFVGADLGFGAAIGGVALFLATAILAGEGRYEFTTAVGTSAMVWTSSGIAVVLGTDPSLIGSLFCFVFVGVAALALGLLGRSRARSRGSEGFAPAA